ncbi:MAG: hypothetical protein J6X44_01860, partial [Thermoguttaceae bacterium]|nr:hypothetical protein [Thermoguttaceae bacterium]
MKDQKIPKTIHYCWFGRGEKPKLAQKCIASWKKYMPDYEIVEWNEDNFDTNKNGYTRMCYEQKKYAFLSDYARLLVVEENGGLYFDTDVEVLKPFDSLLDNVAFFGFETNGTHVVKPKNADLNSGLAFGSIASGLALQKMIEEYAPLLDGRHGVIGCPKLNTDALVKLGLKRNGLLQYFDWGTVYPKEYFNPLNNNTGKINITENTFSIHWYSMAWGSKKTIVKRNVTRVFHRLFGEDCFRWL